jgi:rod shape-determining protein MreC
MNVTEGVRSKIVKLLAPTWRGLSAPSKTSLEMDRLKVENQLLHAQIQSIREWLTFEERIEEQRKHLESLMDEREDNGSRREFFKRRCDHLAQLLDRQAFSLPARIIFREPTSWSSSAWIDVGERDNEAVGRIVVAKNSPVLVGNALIGVVEYVGFSESRLRLISDTRLTPAVRAVRGGESNRIQKTPDRYLAKGELRGSGAPLWRSRNQLLKGVGFNYDYADEEGPAQDLRTSFPEAMIQEGDLLITSGLDGLFPPGLPVATVTKVGQLREGASTYELEARALCPDLNELAHVSVLPSIGFKG